MYNDVTILVNGCDKYEDSWEPCLKLFEKQWQDCPYDFVLNTETKKYKGEIKKVKTINYGKSGTWSERFKYVLEHIEAPYVLFTIEDYFLLNEVNTAVFEKAVSVMNNNPNVGMICLSQTNRENIKTGDYDDDNFYSRVIDKKCMIWCRMCLYRREYLLKLLRVHETIWEFEEFASYRAKKLNYIILQQNNNSSEVFTFKVRIEEGYGITGGQWLPKNKELFDKYGIEVNFDSLGINYELYENAINPTPKEQTKQAKKLDLRERLYNIKKWPKKQTKKLIKTIRKIRSLI